jgi:hypothetical protein
MLKMWASGTTPEGKPIRFIVFGLSHKNLDKLREGYPIKFNGADVGLKDDIELLIFSGETDKSMQREFAKFVGPKTTLKMDPRLKD